MNKIKKSKQNKKRFTYFEIIFTKKVINKCLLKISTEFSLAFKI